MEKQIEILKALLDGKTVYDSGGQPHYLGAEQLIRIRSSEKVDVFAMDELDQFTLTPPHKPLTFERIKKECVSGKHLLVLSLGNKRLFIGFNRAGKLITDNAYGCGSIFWEEEEIGNWTIEEYKGGE